MMMWDDAKLLIYVSECLVSKDHKSPCTRRLVKQEDKSAICPSPWTQCMNEVARIVNL